MAYEENETCGVGAAIEVAEVRPDTVTAVGDELFVPSPSWPSPLDPQQRAVPLLRSAQLWS
mgnify:CR=1 FL=1